MNKLRDVVFALLVLGLFSSALQAQIATYNASGNIVILAPNALETFGIDIISFEGLLTPAPSDDMFGYEFFLSNTNFQVTTGNLGTSTPISGVFVTPVVYNRVPGVRPAQDLAIQYGSVGSPIPVQIPLVPPLLLLLEGGGEFDFLLE